LVSLYPTNKVLDLILSLSQLNPNFKWILGVPSLSVILLGFYSHSPHKAGWTTSKLDIH